MSYYNPGMQNVSPSGQLLTGTGLVAIIFILLLTSEVLYATVKNAQTRFQTLVGYTANAQDMSLTIRQDASTYPDAIPIGLSSNERTGIEFGYSFYLYTLPATFDRTSTFKHVFHKGYPFAWPLMGPGVFMHGETNTMRVIMNTYSNPFTYVDVHNIPVQKWVHVVLNCYKGGLDIFVNGMLANRIPFTDTIPYQNFQDIILFSTANSNGLGQASLPASLNGEQFPISGAFSGSISNLIYTRYALSMGEIQTLMNRGPSSNVRQKSMDRPPYMGDDWWTHTTR